MRLIAALLATALPLAANGRAQILPAGTFAARDGRPGLGKNWTISDEQGAALAAQLNTVSAKTPISIDYEHQTILAAQNGQPAPAAGWMTSFEWQPGQGLYAAVNWTPRAKGFIDGLEYRYISPVILYDATGTVTGLHNAALVSTPAILGMDAVVAALASLSAAALPAPKTSPSQPKAPQMELTTLIALCGLASSASAADVTACIQALMARPAVPAALSAALGLQVNTDEAAALAALTKRLGTPDAATLQLVATLQTQLGTLSAQVRDRQVLEVVDGAIAVHKLIPAQRDWAIGLGKQDMAQLTAFVASAVAVPGLAGQLHGRGDNGGGAQGDALTPLQAMLAAQMGLEPTKYLAQLKAAA